MASWKRVNTEGKHRLPLRIGGPGSGCPGARAGDGTQSGGQSKSSRARWACLWNRRDKLTECARLHSRPGERPSCRGQASRARFWRPCGLCRQHSPCSPKRLVHEMESKYPSHAGGLDHAKIRSIVVMRRKDGSYAKRTN